MAKVIFNELVSHVSGKMCKQENAPIFAYRKSTGAKYVFHRHNKKEWIPTDQSNLFKQAAAQKTLWLGNPTMYSRLRDEYTATGANRKYKTLQGYIFSVAYAFVQGERQDLKA